MQWVAAYIAQSLEKQVQVEQSAEAERWLCALAAQLSVSPLSMNELPQRCALIRPISGHWRSVVIPAQILFVNSSLLRESRFEAEIAAEIALNLGHVVRKHIASRVEQEKWSEFTSGSEISLAPVQTHLSLFGPDGVLTYSDQERLEAVEAGVDLMYRAGFDPRGMITLLQIYARNPEKSPDSPQLVGKLIEKARRTIALRAPLRNPILRSADFLKIQKGLGKRE